MTRKKSRLTLQQPKNLKKKQKLHKPPQLNLIRAIQFSPSPRTGKRKLLPSPFKSPNRIINSPLHKRVKLIGRAHRSLFACTTTQDDNENDWVYIEWEECDEFQFESKKAEKVLDLHGIDESKPNDIENIPCFTEGNSSNPEHDLVKTEWETKNDDELGGQIESKMCYTNLKIASGPEEMSDYATESKRCANETIPCCNETPEHETYFAELLEESTSNELNKESQDMVKLVPEVMRAFSEIGLQSELLTFSSR